MGIPPRDTHVTEPRERKRLSGHNAAMLALLKAGPKTARELAYMVTLKYTQRISDLRAYGCVIHCDEKPDGGSLYTLEYEPGQGDRLW